MLNYLYRDDDAILVGLYREEEDDDDAMLNYLYGDDDARLVGLYREAQADDDAMWSDDTAHKSSSQPDYAGISLTWLLQYLLLIQARCWGSNEEWTWSDLDLDFFYQSDFDGKYTDGHHENQLAWFLQLPTNMWYDNEKLRYKRNDQVKNQISAGML